MPEDKATTPVPATLQELRQALAPFGKADRWHSSAQLLNTLIPYAAVWGLLLFLVRRDCPFWMLVVPVLLGALLLVRIFVLFHDCTHVSFFASHGANVFWGYVTGILTFTPYQYWRHNHNTHHNTYADLDHRGLGDIWTLTVEEYRAASPRRRLGYRLVRHPLVFLGIGPGFMFLITQRLLHQWEGKRERFSVAVANLAILAIIWTANGTIGLKTYLLIQMPIMLLAGGVGVWLFYVQHQFEGVYWSRHAEWDPVKAALRGSSYYRLPRVLRWFTANIGLHHVHHILPRIPNYKLQAAFDAVPILRTVKPLTLAGSLHSVRLNLWDEQAKALVSFRSVDRGP